jgi:subtilisin family serine protease
MTISKKKIGGLAALTLVLISSGSGLQKIRQERNKESQAQPARPSVHRAIGRINGGLPVRAEGPRYAPGQVLVRFKPNVSTQLVSATLAAYETQEIKSIPRLNLYRVKIPEWASVEEMARTMSLNPDVLYAGPNYRARIMVTPNDPLFRYQYALNNTGQDIGAQGSPSGKAKADIRATIGWEETKGTAETIIAILDSGVDFDHPDIKNKIVSRGRDFANDDEDATDDNGHGTFVAGIAAADTNNDEGIAGVAWNCRILPVKVTDAEGSAWYDDLINGITWAADNGAQVINMSLGGDAADNNLRDALSYAHERGVVITASAGNENTAVFYPAAYDAYCLAVAATDYDDLRASYSCFGPEVDVAAPGEAVLSLVPTWFWGPEYLPYAFGYGTSASSPHVAGLAALLKGLKPWLTADEIMEVIRFSSDDVNSGEHSGKDDYIGYGRINMEKALVPIKLSK